MGFSKIYAFEGKYYKPPITDVFMNEYSVDASDFMKSGLNLIENKIENY